MVAKKQVGNKGRFDKCREGLAARNRSLSRMIGSLSVACVIIAGTVLLGQSVVPERITVSATGSFTGQAFEYTRVLREQSDKGSIFDVRYPSPIVSASEINNTVPAELYLPANLDPEMKIPGVVCLHIMGNGSFDLERLLCLGLARRGVATLFFKLPHYGERGGTVGKAGLIVSEETLIQGFEQGVEDARRAVDILSALPEINPQRIGITGISLGGIQAATICGSEPRIGKAFLMLAGGDLKTIISSAREARYLKAFIEGLPEEGRARVWTFFEEFDPINAGPALSKLAERGNFRMVCAENDEVVPPESSRKLARAAGFADHITWLLRCGHYSAMAGLPKILGEVADFFAADVPTSWKPSRSTREKTPIELLGVFLSGFSAFLDGVVEESAAHLVGGEATLSFGGKSQEFSFDFAKGGRGRFRIMGDFPKVGKGGLGAGDYPWLLGNDGVVFCGTKEVEAGRTASALISPTRWMTFKIFCGLLGSTALSPEALKNYLSITPLDSVDGKRRIRANIHVKKTKGMIDLTFVDDATLASVAWDVGGTKGEMVFRYWRLNSAADDSLFEPDPEFKRYEVLQADLLQVFASVFEFGMEGLE